MSCSIQVKSRNAVKCGKKVNNNVIHRTTSETIRLGEPDILINNNSSRQAVVIPISPSPTPPPPPPPLPSSSSPSQPSLQKKSACSFQITGVSLAQRADFGDDSADDLDESHTDDISRITDNETPSISEDTCSRDADEVNTGTCAVSCSIDVTNELNDLHLATRSDGSSSSLVFKCIQMDPTATKASVSPHTSSREGRPVITTTSGIDRFPGTRFRVVKVETSKPFRRGRWLCMDYLDHHSTNKSTNVTSHKASTTLNNYDIPQPHYTMTTITSEPQFKTTNIGTTKILPSTQAVGSGSSSVPCVSPQPPLFATKPQLQDDEVIKNMPASRSLYTISGQNLPTLASQQIYSVCPTVTAVHRENSVTSTSTTTKFDQACNTASYTQSDNFISVVNDVKHPSISTTSSRIRPSANINVIDKRIVQNIDAFQNEMIPILMKRCNIYFGAHANELSCNTNKASSTVTHIDHLPFKKVSSVTPASDSVVSKSKPELNAASKHDFISKRELAWNPKCEPEVKTINCESRITSTCGLAAFQQSTSPYSVLKFQIDSGLSTSPLCIPGGNVSTEEIETSSPNNTSAIIDTKIEQAMDLVKSHLLYAVREEVKVLKIRIAELLERINQLETENTFLKANARPEVLVALNNRPQQSNNTAEDGIANDGHAPNSQ